MKTIQILTRSISTHRVGVDPISYSGGWHAEVAKQLKKATNRYKPECWRPERESSEARSWKENQIRHRIFPSTCLELGGRSFEISVPMLKELSMLKNQAIVHLHGPYRPIGYLISALFGQDMPIVVQIHSPTRAYSRVSGLRYFIRKFIFKNVDKFFVLHDEEKKELSEMFGKEIAEVQPMGIDFDNLFPVSKEEARRNLGINADISLVCYLGRLARVKGVDILIKGFAKLDLDAKLAIGGEGPMKEHLKDLSRELKVEDKVDFLGFIPESKKRDFIAAADVFVFPSLSEGYPIVPIEVLACKTPLVAARVRNIPEIASNFKGGTEIVPPGDPGNIAEAISKALSGEFDGSEIDREAGKRFYDWRNIIGNTIQTYDDICKRYEIKPR